MVLLYLNVDYTAITIRYFRYKTINYTIISYRPEGVGRKHPQHFFWVGRLGCTRTTRRDEHTRKKIQRGQKSLIFVEAHLQQYLVFFKTHPRWCIGNEMEWQTAHIPMWYINRGWVFSLRRSMGTQLAFASFDCNIPLHVQSHACDVSHALAVPSRSTQEACKVDLLKGTTTTYKNQTYARPTGSSLPVCMHWHWTSLNIFLWIGVLKKSYQQMTCTRWGAKGSEKRPTVTAEELQKHTSEEATTKL